MRTPLVCRGAAIVALACLAALAGDDDEPDREGIAYFEKHVRPILAEHCYRCHSAKAEKLRGGLFLDTRAGWTKGGDRGPAIVPGDPDNSVLVQSVRYDDAELQMPPNGKLSDREIEHLVAWISRGAPDPRDDADAPGTRPSNRSEQGRQFWSFQPLKKSLPPSPAATGTPALAAWPRTDIDRFVLAKAIENKVTPGGRADRRTLMRRAYFDLIGLPPTSQQVAEFLNDPAPDAYDKLIDRLLESPHYGERWGRHWLDVARFAESHGFEQDYDRPHAYHFRDFVIKALNADMPYDQFVRWQIAGDEFEPDNPLAMMATGFLGAGVFPTQLTEKEFEPARYDELDDMISTTGTAMLGLTIGCARCHDHKFDPIASEDYYRLVSAFTTTIRSNIELDLDPRGNRDALSKWESEHAPLVASLEKFERDELPVRFDEWLKARVGQASSLPRSQSDHSSATWVVLDLVEQQSHGGATLTRLDDGSVLAGGANPDFDKYTFVAHTYLKNVTAVRLEALAHESLVKSGPGRAPNGNIGLSKFTVAAEPLNAAPSAAAPDATGAKTATPAITLLNPRATFEQNNSSLSIAASLDDNPKTGWAVDPQFGKDHAAAFEFAGPVGFDGGTKWTFTLEFNVNNKHNIGRPRLSIATAAPPLAIDAKSQRQGQVEIDAILGASGGKPNEQQRATLLQLYRSADPQWRKLHDQVQTHAAAKPKPKLTMVMVASEGFKPIPHHADDRGFPHYYKETHILKRGDTSQKQGVAAQGFLPVLMTSPEAEKPWLVEPPSGSRTSHRRRALANWLTDADRGAGHLLARVIVNRLWQHHIGRGIVATPSDFGKQGEPPTHPELLDWLAQRLIADGWRLKSIHKLITTSAVYMQSSEFDESDAKTDPDNRWCWRYEPRRLEAELVRDAMLAVSGHLDRTMFGPGTLDEGMKRRSIYFMIKRSRLVPMMQLFDAPEPLVGVAARPATTIAPQALMFMNNAHVRGYARGLAQRLADTAEKSAADFVRQGYLLAVAREPSVKELSGGEEFLRSQTEAYAAEKVADARQLALIDLCQVLMSLNEFVFID